MNSYVTLHLNNLKFIQLNYLNNLNLIILDQNFMIVIVRNIFLTQHLFLGKLIKENQVAIVSLIPWTSFHEKQ